MGPREGTAENMSWSCPAQNVERISVCTPGQRNCYPKTDLCLPTYLADRNKDQTAATSDQPLRLELRI
ncbi:TPA: hypothetical protein N0F65_009846 [Lagenidium giganteum]|uniref:Uncharacterized protein n=1 Tax=Lagenidium giganteum TaxID=4803 RepID=A0AAV2YJH2_9STRA|nr:TPA: hypothetical protein N0F65_009846 [Lagenidium giganteum]